MKCNRVNLKLTFSAALAGLLLSLAPSAAYGHGNNPKTTIDPPPDPTGPNDPPPPSPTLTDDGGGGVVPGSDTAFGPSGGAGLGPAGFDAISTRPQVFVLVGVDVILSDVLDVSAQVLFDPATVGRDFPAGDPVALRIPVDAFGIVHGSGSLGGFAPNGTPAPGWLAWLGLAAAAARRRRRRT